MQIQLEYVQFSINSCYYFQYKIYHVWHIVEQFFGLLIIRTVFIGGRAKIRALHRARLYLGKFVKF